MLPMSKLDTAIATLNTLEVGSLDKIGEQLLSVREELARHALDDLVEKLDACRVALAAACARPSSAAWATSASRCSNRA